MKRILLAGAAARGTSAGSAATPKTGSIYVDGLCDGLPRAVAEATERKAAEPE